MKDSHSGLNDMVHMRGFKLVCEDFKKMCAGQRMSVFWVMDFSPVHFPGLLRSIQNQYVFMDCHQSDYYKGKKEIHRYGKG